MMTTDTIFQYATLRRLLPQTEVVRWGFVHASYPRVGEPLGFLLVEEPPREFIERQVVTTRVREQWCDGADIYFVTESGSIYQLQLEIPRVAEGNRRDCRLQRSPQTLLCYDCGSCIRPGELFADTLGMDPIVAVRPHQCYHPLTPMLTDGYVTHPGIRCHDCYRRQVLIPV